MFPAIFNPSEEHMGSTIIGIVIPETIAGLVMPQDKEIGRDGSSRVGMGGRA